jgi:putative membrane protein
VKTWIPWVEISSPSLIAAEKGVQVLVAFASSLLMGGMMGPGWMMGPGMMGRYTAPNVFPRMSGWMWLVMGLGWLSRLAFLGVLIVGMVLLLRRLNGTTDRASAAGTGTALEILQRRYAAGEITREEYAYMRQDIESGPGT